ncbi:CerR family C-terminal domain-containing protein [Planctomycetota bacterium]|nr:CerR family C-terminal domain-containing protein [Planctomycetota bacterium]
MQLDPYNTDSLKEGSSIKIFSPEFAKANRPEPEIDPESPTRDRLLLAACHVFSKNGYHDSTISEISKLAKANIAAVNYHFGDKQNLYLQTIKYAFKITTDKYDPNGNLPETAPARDRLTARITALIRPSFDLGPAGYTKELFAWEMGVPTGLFDQFVKEVLEPLKNQFHAMLRELLGPDCTQDDVHLCGFSIISQCHSPLLRMHVRKILLKYRPSVADVNFIIEHVIDFSLAGIESRKRIIAKRKQTNDSPDS